MEMDRFYRPITKFVLVVKRRRHEPIRRALFIVPQSTRKPTAVFSVHAASRSSALWLRRGLFRPQARRIAQC